MTVEHNMIEQAARAVGMITEKRPSLMSLARFLGVSNSTIHRWRAGEMVPTRMKRDQMLAVLVEFSERYDELVAHTRHQLNELSNG